jgi:hypothetical protein
VISLDVLTKFFDTEKLKPEALGLTSDPLITYFVTVVSVTFWVPAVVDLIGNLYDISLMGSLTGSLMVVFCSVILILSFFF